MRASAGSWARFRAPGRRFRQGQIRGIGENQVVGAPQRASQPPLFHVERLTTPSRAHCGVPRKAPPGTGHSGPLGIGIVPQESDEDSPRTRSQIKDFQRSITVRKEPRRLFQQGLRLRPRDENAGAYANDRLQNSRASMM